MAVKRLDRQLRVQGIQVVHEGNTFARAVWIGQRLDSPGGDRTKRCEHLVHILIGGVKRQAAYENLGVRLWRRVAPGQFVVGLQVHQKLSSASLATLAAAFAVVAWAPASTRKAAPTPSSRLAVGRTSLLGTWALAATLASTGASFVGEPDGHGGVALVQNTAVQVLDNVGRLFDRGVLHQPCDLGPSHHPVPLDLAVCFEGAL
mmetsp:Transcript_113178/g.283294  ORF Transcript_113178/g.283294 Transcript_113178/m.283294 type:complete len:204 (+) Transcript_113178:180-791(+)